MYYWKKLEHNERVFIGIANKMKITNFRLQIIACSAFLKRILIDKEFQISEAPM